MFSESCGEHSFLHARTSSLKSKTFATDIILFSSPSWRSHIICNVGRVLVAYSWTPACCLISIFVTFGSITYRFAFLPLSFIATTMAHCDICEETQFKSAVLRSDIVRFVYYTIYDVQCKWTTEKCSAALLFLSQLTRLSKSVRKKNTIIVNYRNCFYSLFRR